MRLTEIVASGAVKPALGSPQRDEAIAELVDAIVACGAADAGVRDELLARVMQREKRSTTGFGHGVAVPHAKHTGLSRVVAAIGLSERGIDFEAIDGQPVYSVVLLLSPEDEPSEHLQAMEVIFRNLSNEAFRRSLRRASSAEDVAAALEDADAHHFHG